MCSLASCHIILYRAEKPEGSDVFHLSVRSVVAAPGSLLAVVILITIRTLLLLARERVAGAEFFKHVDASTRSDRDGGAQAQILRLGLRGSGTKCRPAEAARRADGNAVRTRRPRAYAAAERGRTPFARAADQAAGFARIDLLEQHL